MSKHKSEVLTFNIQLKVKFPQAVITKIGTLPTVIPKTFRTAVRRKTRDGCFWHYVCKTINLCSTKVALTVFTEICSVFFFMEIKVIMVKEIQWELTEEIFFQEICASWKQMLGIDKKSFFLLKHIYLYNL